MAGLSPQMYVICPPHRISRVACALRFALKMLQRHATGRTVRNCDDGGKYTDLVFLILAPTL